VGWTDRPPINFLHIKLLAKMKKKMGVRKRKTKKRRERDGQAQFFNYMLLSPEVL